jgi:pyruvate/2-oxoglutarate dehydrogenase complex dihydrolipoamide acyltransferase (E2) component
VATVEVLLPQYGMGMDDAVIVQWLKAEGDTVAEGEDLVEIEAAKTTEIVPSPAGGVLVEIRAQPEDVVAVQQVIAVIEEG